MHVCMYVYLYVHVNIHTHVTYFCTQLAGVVGPTVGGLLYAYHPFTPVLTVTAGYLAMSIGVSLAFPRYLVPAIASGKDKEKQA